jgi:hypothetical protein
MMVETITITNKILTQRRKKPLSIEIDRYTYIHIYTHTYIHTHIYTHTYIHTHIYTHTHTHTYICVCMHAGVCVNGILHFYMLHYLTKGSQH